MIIKTILIALLGIFFMLNGLNHLFNGQVLEEYARKRGLFSPKQMVLLSGIGLIFGGAALMAPMLRIYGILALLLFMVVATFTMHRFWEEKDKYDRLLESMNFAKNLAIITELVYIGCA